MSIEEEKAELRLEIKKLKSAIHMYPDRVQHNVRLWAQVNYLQRIYEDLVNAVRH